MRHHNMKGENRGPSMNEFTKDETKYNTQMS